MRPDAECPRGIVSDERRHVSLGCVCVCVRFRAVFVYPGVQVHLHALHQGENWMCTYAVLCIHACACLYTVKRPFAPTQCHVLLCVPWLYLCSFMCSLCVPLHGQAGPMTPIAANDLSLLSASANREGGILGLFAINPAPLLSKMRLSRAEQDYFHARTQARRSCSHACT